MLVDGECTHWDSIPGYQINSFGVWVETWGDGVNNGEYEWDDGNSEDGDGCSSSWKVEPGFRWDDKGCREIVPPYATISHIDKNNVWTISFSETVIIKNLTLFHDSLRAKLNEFHHILQFQFAIFDPDHELKEGENTTEFKIRIFDLKRHLLGNGNEIIQFWFRNTL